MCSHIVYSLGTHIEHRRLNVYYCTSVHIGTYLYHYLSHGRRWFTRIVDKHNIIIGTQPGVARTTAINLTVQSNLMHQSWATKTYLSGDHNIIY